MKRELPSGLSLCNHSWQVAGCAFGRLVASILVGMLTAVAAHAQAAAQRKAIRVTPGQHWPQVWLVPQASALGVLKLQVANGAAHEGHRAGITRLALEAALEQAPGRSGLRRAVFEAGGALVIQSHVDRTEATLVMPAGTFLKFAALLLERTLKTPVSKRGISQARERLKLVRPTANAMDMGDVLASVMVDAPAYKNPPLGDPEAQELLSTKEIARWQKTHPLAGLTTVVVAGPFSEHQARALGAAYGQAARVLQRSSPEIPTPARYAYPAWTDQKVRAFVLNLESPDDWAAAHVLASAVEIRVQDRLRQKGLAYSVTAQVLQTGWADVLVLMVPYSPEVWTAAEAEVESVVRDMELHPPSEEQWRGYAHHALASVWGVTLEDHADAVLGVVSAGRHWDPADCAGALLTVSAQRGKDMIHTRLGPDHLVEVHYSRALLEKLYR